METPRSFPALVRRIPGCWAGSGWGWRIIATLASAGMGIFVFEPFGWWGLALVAWLPFVCALKEATPRQGFYLGLLHGLLLFGFTLSWFQAIFGLAAVALWGILAFFTAGAALILALASRSDFPGAGRAWPLVFATVWAGVEYFRSEWFVLSFPWITAGTGFAPCWLTPAVGVYGVTFCIILGNALFVQSRSWGVTVTGMIGLAGLSFMEDHSPGEMIRVGLVQDESGDLRTLQDLSSGLLDEVDAVVWPEYSLGEIDRFDFEVARRVAGERRIFVAAGMESREGVEANTALTISGEGVLGRHIKNHPVPFFDDGVAGTTADAVETSLGRFGTPVCFDCDHQEVTRRMTAGGAEYFLVPSLDPGEWTARQHEQHGALFRHRAAECGRWMAVASGSGVTQIIDSRGQVRERLPLMKSAVLIGAVASRSGTTLFQLGGWLIGPGMVVGTVVVLLGLAWQKWTR